MPFYEYICKSCYPGFLGVPKADDIIHCIYKSITDETIELCPTCGNELSRRFGAPTLNFSGGGWARDGYNKTPKTEVKNENN
jgi:predicted nucleic acid-binding Zn ribbon protein